MQILPHSALSHPRSISLIMGQCISACFGNEPISASYAYEAYDEDRAHAQVQAEQIVTLIIKAEKPGAELNAQICDVVRTTGWNEWIAEKVLSMLSDAIERGTPLALAMADSVKEATEAARQFTLNHPYVAATVIALGVLALLFPAMLTLLGFGEEGIIAGTTMSPIVMVF
jgi:hypothetical protein